MATAEQQPIQAEVWPKDKTKSTTATCPSSLSEKILAVTASVKQVKKGGTNKDANYKYIRIEDAVAAVLGEMCKHGLIMTPVGMRDFSMTEQTKGYNVNLVYTWRVEDTKTGEYRDYDIPGSGWDFHDKGTYKANTGSRKYALILIFQLPVGDDPEERGGIDREAQKAKQDAIAEKKFAKLASTMGKTIEEVKAELAKNVPDHLEFTYPERHGGNYAEFTNITEYCLSIDQVAAQGLRSLMKPYLSKQFAKNGVTLIPADKMPELLEKLVGDCGINVVEKK